MGGCDGCAAWGSCTFSGNNVCWTCSTFFRSKQEVTEALFEGVLNEDNGDNEAELKTRSKSALEERDESALLRSSRGRKTGLRGAG